MKKIVWLFALSVLANPLAAKETMTAQPAVPVIVHSDQQALLRSDNPKLAANKKLVFDFWREVFQAHNVNLAAKYMTEDYIQHNPTAPTGRQAFMDIFGQFKPEPVRPEIDNLVSIVAEGDMVVLAFKTDLADPKNPKQTYTTTWFDMLRIKDGKIAEHWDYGTKGAN